MKQMTKDEMIKLYFKIINNIIDMDWDFTRQHDNIQYQRLMAKKELLEEILGVKDDNPLPIKISGEEVIL